MKMYFWKQAWLLAPLLFCLATGQVQAATITADGDCTLADAITAANTDTATGNCIGGDAGKDTIELTYSPLLQEEAPSILTMSIIITDPIDKKRLPQITTEILINGNGNTIDANKDSSTGSVLHISSNGILTLNETTVTGGTGYITEDGHSHGGGIYSNGGSLTLNNSTVSGNTASRYGGGIYSDGGFLTLNNSTVSENSTSFYGLGGGIHADSTTLRLTGSTVSGNESWFGGGIFATSNGITLTNSTVSGNKGSWGGGIYICISSAILTNSTVSENAASDGGGIYSDFGFLLLTNSTVSRNEVVNDGGGIFISNYFDSIITSTNPTITLINSLISGNKSTAGEGNELYNASDSSIIYANSFNLFGHSDESDAEAFAYFTPDINDVNATSDGTSGILKPTALSAILLPLTDNGGPTQTHALVTDSPAVDLDTACSGNLTEDQRGEPRPDTGCDAGAFEGSINLSNSTAFLPTLYLLLLNN